MSDPRPGGHHNLKAQTGDQVLYTGCTYHTLLLYLQKVCMKCASPQLKASEEHRLSVGRRTEFLGCLTKQLQPVCALLSALERGLVLNQHALQFAVLALGDLSMQTVQQLLLCLQHLHTCQLVKPIRQIAEVPCLTSMMPPSISKILPTNKITMRSAISPGSAQWPWVWSA